MIPSSVDIANEALHPDIVLEHKKEKSALLIKVSVPKDFGLTATKIRKTTKCQDLKNEDKRTRKLKKAEIAPVIVRAIGMMKKTLTECLKIILRNITPKEHKWRLSGVQ